MVVVGACTSPELNRSGAVEDSVGGRIVNCLSVCREMEGSEEKEKGRSMSPEPIVIDDSSNSLELSITLEHKTRDGEGWTLVLRIASETPPFVDRGTGESSSGDGVD